MLPIILQHVRELAEVHAAVAERERYKIITPFPPSGQDFRDFVEDELVFGDPPASGDSASRDTVRAWEFFQRTDNLYYDYSYGIKSQDYLLSQLCQRYFLNAQTESSDLDFTTTFTERRNSFLRKYLRSTVGDLGNFEFRYTTLSPISWNSERIVLNSAEVERLKVKAIKVYEDLELEDVGFANALIEEVRALNHASIQYDFGFFDVIREWMDPRLFENAGWTFASGNRALYGEADPFFVGNDVKLCFAQRFYLVKNYAATPHVVPPPPPPVVRDHRTVDEPRRRVRNALINRQVARINRESTPPVRTSVRTAMPMETLMTLNLAASTATALPAPTPRAGYVWVPENGAVPGHWERERAGARAQPVPKTPATIPIYKVAAVKCRVVPPTP